MSYIKSKLHRGRSVRMKKALIIHIFYILQESKKKNRTPFFSCIDYRYMRRIKYIFIWFILCVGHFTKSICQITEIVPSE